MTAVVGENSYIDVTEADNYFNENLSSDSWNALTNDVKNKCLVSAAEQISQSLSDECQFPIDPAEIDSNLKKANAQLGLFYAQDPEQINTTDSGSNVKRVKAGPVAVEFFNRTQGKSTRFPPIVHRFLLKVPCYQGSSSSETLIAVGGTKGVTDQHYKFTGGSV